MMSVMVTPTAKARWVLETMGIHDAPAPHLDEIAQKQNIRVKKRSLPSEKDLSGMLLYKGDKKGIIINTWIDNHGHHNFTFAHELGHYFLGHKPPYILDGGLEFRCTNQDMEEAYGRPVIEIEANQFAVELLMPEKMFRPLLAGSVFDFTLMYSLANRFYVSKHACGNRILDFIREPYILICSQGFSVTAQKSSNTMHNKFERLLTIPKRTAAYDAIRNKRNQSCFVPCKALNWFHTGSGKTIYEWTRGNFKKNVAMTLLRW